MIRETIVPAIPDVRSDNVAEVLRAIKSTLDVREGSVGDPLDQMVTLRELAALNVVESGGTTQTSFGRSLPVVSVLPPPISGYNPATDLTTPPAPSNLRARGGFTNVFLEWDGAPYRNHGYTEIWRSQTDNLGTAVLVGTTAASVYGDPVSPDTTYFYWIRFVSAAAITGPYNSTSGTQATTAIDISQALSAISADITNSQLFIDLGSRITAVENDQRLNAAALSVAQDFRNRINAEVSKSGSAILTLNKVTDTQATSITGLTTRVGTAEGSITNLQTTTATQATSISTLNTTVGGHTTSISTLTSTTNGLSGQYSVKIDNNGHVSGFGLASTTTTAGPTSAFIVRADRFAIVGANDTTDPLGTLNPTKVPFVVLTTPTTINGKVYPAGTWMNTAFIANATITTAQISDLTADKITAGSVTAALGLSTGKIFGGVAVSTNTSDGTYGQLLYPFASSNFGTGFFLGVDSSVYKFYVGSPSQNMNWNGSSLTVTGNINATSGTFRNITVYDASNNVILSSGGINTATLGLGGLAYQNSVTTGQVSGLGTLATQNSVSTGQVSGLGGLATQDSVFVGSTVKFSDGTTMATGDFVNRLTKIGTGNISTFIDGLAVTNAYIGNAAISTAKIDDLAVTGAKIADATIGIAKITNSIQSDNYVANSSGWLIRRSDGYAEFGNVKVRGDVQATSLTASTVNTDNIVGFAVSKTYGTTTSGSSASLTVSVPSGAAAVIILVGLGAGLYGSGGEGAGTYYPVVGDLYIDGTAVVNNSASAIVWSVNAPPAGDYVIQAVRGSFSGVMSITVLVNKR